MGALSPCLCIVAQLLQVLVHGRTEGRLEFITFNGEAEKASFVSPHSLSRGPWPVSN